MSDVVQTTIATYEATAEAWFAKHRDNLYMKAEADFFIENLPGKKILDVGCGAGNYARYFSEQKLVVKGIDLTAKLVEIAAQNAPLAQISQMDMRKISFPKESFDGLWVCASLLHLPKAAVPSVLQDFYRLLKPSGVLYLAVKEGEGERFVTKEEDSGLPKFFAFYKQAEIVKLLETSGFRISKVDRKVGKSGYWLYLFAQK